MDIEEGDGATDSQATQTLRNGEIVADKYRIERLIGSGGMAEVYAAVNVKTDRRVALKWILPVLATSREVMLRFRREALAAGRISHPNVVTIFDVVEHQGSACMVMELLDGEMLSDRIVRTGPLPFVEAVAILLPAMRGVAAAHAQGVIHRDLKPHNIFLCLDADGSIREVKVLDFGVSKLTIADAATAGDITLNGNVVGTPEYMAPEQVRATKEIDHRIDVYSLGVVLYETLAGRPPFVNQHFSGLMLEIMQNDAPPLASLRPDVPRRLAGVVHRAMIKDPERRFPDVPSFIQALEAVARDELRMMVGTPPDGVLTRAGIPRPTPSQALQLPAPKSDRVLRIAAIASLVLGIASLVGAWLWRAYNNPREVVRPSPAEKKTRPAIAAPSPPPGPPAPPASASSPPASAAAFPQAAQQAGQERAAPRSTSPSPSAASSPGSASAPGSPGADSRPRGARERVKPVTAVAVTRPARTPPTVVPPAIVTPPATTGPHPRTSRAGRLSVDDF